MAELTTVPTFVFFQGDPWSGDHPSEHPVQVEYFRGSICLSQNGNEIILLPEFYEKLFKEIKKHFPEAQMSLGK